MKCSIKDFFSKFEQIRSFMQIWIDLLKKSLMDNFTFPAVLTVQCIVNKQIWKLCILGITCGYVVIQKL